MICQLLNAMPLPRGAAWVPFDWQLLHQVRDELDEPQLLRVIDQAHAGQAAVLTINRQPLCAVGVCDMHGGLGHAWAVIDRELKHQHPLLLTRAVRRGLYITAQYMGLGVVHLFVELARVDAARWAEALGFRLIGQMQIFEHPERSHAIYARSI